MPDTDESDDVQPAAKRSIYLYYLDIRRDGKGVGPHPPGSINSWLEDGRIAPDVPVRRIDQSNWTTFREIKRFANFLDKIPKLPPRQYVKGRWEDDPVTEKQLAKLRFFDLPFPSANLTKGVASRFIQFFVEVDPERQAAYQKLPAEEEKLTQLRELVKKLPSEERANYPFPAGLTKGEVVKAMYEIEGRLDGIEYEKMELEAKKDEEYRELMFIDNHYNQEEIRKDFGYKKLTQKHLKLLREYLAKHDPGWSPKSRYDTAGIVLKLFPELKKAEKKAEKTFASYERKDVPKGKGRILILVAVIGILLYALKETLFHASYTSVAVPSAMTEKATTISATEEQRAAWKRFAEEDKKERELLKEQEAKRRAAYEAKRHEQDSVIVGAKPAPQ
jgi:hypothetical protein